MSEWTSAQPSGKPYTGQTSRGSYFVSLPMTTEEGEELWWRGYLTPAAIERTKNQLATLGWQSEQRIEDWQPAEDSVRVLVEEEEWQDQKRRKIAIIANNKSKAKREDDMANALLSGSSLPATKTVDPPTASDDEIPF